MKKLVLFAVSLLLLGVQVAWAQRTISGKVTSADEPMGHPQVAVKVPGTSTGTVTNFDGEFTLSVPDGVSKLEFSCLGLTTKIVDITGSFMTVKMDATAIALTEVSITGYGVSRKAATTGAAAQIEGDVVKKSTESNVINGLQGNVAGLQISASTGQPGAPTSARIRGTSSVNSGNAPLYVIDGVPVSNGGYGMYTYTDPLASLNPEDIENISVLKDASATSIYGSRASNGVIVITTKKGSEGKTQFSLNAKIGMSTSPFVKHNFQKINADEYREYLVELKRNADPLLSSSDERILSGMKNDFSGYDILTQGTTDWWDAVTRIGIIQDYSLAASGGNDKYNFFASVGYFNNQGFVIGTDFTRYSARLNLDYKPTKWLTFGMNLSGAYAEVNTVPNSLAYASPIWSAMSMRPTDPVKIKDAQTGEEKWYDGFNEGYNPVAIYKDENHNVAFQQQYKALFSPYLRVQFYKNVFFQTKIGIDFVTVKEKNIWSPTVDPQGAQMNGLVQRTDETSAVMTITNTLNWMPTIAEKHNLNFLVGQEAQRFNEYSDYMSGFNYALPELMDIANAVETSASSATSNAALASYFANVEYDYDGKYYLSASVRGDGSSRFGDTKWGAFWSVGGKYRISAENFMASTQSWLNNLTLRVSYGTTGNQNVGYYAAQALYSTGRYGGLTALVPGSLGNPNLTWESRNKFDVGLEFSVFDRLTVEVDYYNDITDDMIFGVPLSAACGFSSLTTNIGKMRNQGVELQINALLMNRRNFQWTLAINLTSNDNKVLKLATDDPIIGGFQILEEGKSTSEFYLREWAGVDPATGRPRWYDKDGNYVFNYNEAAPRYLGSADPKIYGGISTRFDFYNVDVSLQFNYSYGNKLFINDLRYMEGLGERMTSPITYYVFDNRWKNPGDETDVPQVRWGGNNGADGWSSRQIVDASYFRIKSIMIGYTLPKKHAQKAYLSSFRAYVSIDNLYTVTSKNFRGFDPEAGLGMSQAANYPLPINYTLGINVGF